MSHSFIGYIMTNKAMDKIIAALRPEPNNYFHYVPQDILGIINLYLVPPAFQDLIEEIFQNYIVTYLPAKYIQIDKITYDIAYYFYKYYGVGPSDWAIASNYSYSFSSEFNLHDAREFCCLEIIRQYIQHEI